MKNKLGFTLIELLAVLVVLAILALISIPITIRIINNARENSYKRSIESYGKVFEKVIAMDNTSNAQDDYKLLKDYVNKVEDNYSGNRVKCDFSLTSNTDEDYSTLINGRLKLVRCHVVDSNDNQLSNNMYVYKNGVLMKETIYESYAIGDTFTIKESSYHIIADSPIYQDYVVALKDVPLTTEDINEYGVGHINKYSQLYPGIVHSEGEYGFVAYYTSETCGYVNGSMLYSGCITDYDLSDVRQIVDNWGSHIFTSNELKKVGNYKVRLISISDIEGLDYTRRGDDVYIKGQNVPDWFRSTKYYQYWTMTPYNENSNVWRVGYDGDVALYGVVYDNYNLIRPVINVYKDKIG